jgi:hypothetical protein
MRRGTAMEDDQRREQIEELEARIEQLAEGVERCRKISIASRVAIAFGAMLLAAMALRAIQFGPVPLLAALSAILGGIVGLGSNRSTRIEAAAALQAAEAERAALIDRIAFTVIEGGGKAGNGKDDGAAFRGREDH